MNANDNISYLLVRNSSKDLLTLMKELKSRDIKFKVVDVEKNRMEKYLWRDYRTFDLPILVTKNKILKGKEAIVSFVRRKGPPHKYQYTY